MGTGSKQHDFIGEFLIILSISFSEGGWGNSCGRRQKHIMDPPEFLSEEGSKLVSQGFG